jgi:hypothetical protein
MELSLDVLFWSPISIRETAARRCRWGVGRRSVTGLSGRTQRDGVQIVGYETERPPDETEDETGRDPALLVATDATVDRVPLTPGSDLSYVLGERHCAGAIAEEGHRPCSAADAPYCPRHTDRWPCARCRGDCELPLPSCREEHAVYLAAFAPDTFKVGVTRSWRLHTRLREQGADRGAHVHTVADGRIARQLEAEYAAEIPDRVRVKTKVAGLGRPVDEGAWDRLRSEFDVVETFAFDYGLDLDGPPVSETVASGTVRGVKGRVLLLDVSGTTYGVNLRDLVGHEVTEGGTPADRQSSLGAF